MEIRPSGLIYEVIERQARRTPERTAAIFRGRELTYRQLIEEVKQLSARLLRQGVGAESVVAICLERSSEMLIAMLAVLQAGGAYLPLDPGFPAERLAFMITDSSTGLVITRSAMASRFSPSRLSESPVRTLVIDQPGDVRDEDGSVKTAQPGPANLAYLMYTSGSTGTPKGVMIEHRNVVNFFAGMDELLGTEPGVWLAVTSISFDISVLELLWTLARGYTVVIQSDEEKFSATGEYGIGAQLKRYGVTHFQCTPTMAELLVQRPLVMEGLKGLRKLLLGGEVLPPALADYLSRNIAGDLHNMYGPTETTIWSTSARIRPGEAITIGWPIVNTQVRVIAEDGRECSGDEVGEIYISGAGVARGYWRRPELTAQRFVTSTFGADAPVRLYKTGDRGCWRADGALEFRGRADDQIKIRGYRVEPGEVEAVVREHPAVLQSAVVAYAQGSVARLAAYVVAKAGCGITPEELRVAASRKLPEYMVPAAFVFIPSLPTTPNGKIDRNALPPPEELQRSEAVEGIGATPDEIESTLERWCREEMPGDEPLDSQTDFFQMGGQSLSLVRLFARINQTYRVQLSAATIFEAPTIEKLAQRIRNGAAAATKSSLISIRPAGSKPPLYLFPDINGSVIGFDMLVRSLPEELPVYGVESTWLHSEAAPPLRLEEIAARHVEDIRSIQPHGPFYLLGYSFGGLVAFEAAQQLVEAGETVGMLGMLDTWQTERIRQLDAVHSRRQKLARRAHKALMHARMLWAGPNRLKYFENHLFGRFREALGALIWHAPLQWYTRPGKLLPQFLRQPRRINRFVARRYVARLYPGRITVFRAAEGIAADDERYDDSLGWRDIAVMGVEMHEVPGCHRDILQEAQVWRRVRQCLEIHME
ncbi:MAG TPA: amino acid adenylation domain-containing protein [Candidatus Binataceae bacterium]|nr:amino acid adenylation domain-containing protein [Candidatus Binataceae bacterium]